MEIFLAEHKTVGIQSPETENGSMALRFGGDYFHPLLII